MKKVPVGIATLSITSAIVYIPKNLKSNELSSGIEKKGCQPIRQAPELAEQIRLNRISIFGLSNIENENWRLKAAKPE